MVRGSIFLTIIIMGGIIMTLPENDSTAQDEKVRNPCVAGSFYPGDSTTLSQTVIKLLDQAEPPKIEGTIIGMVAPQGHVPFYPADVSHGHHQTG